MKHPSDIVLAATYTVALLILVADILLFWRSL
jgi:hypothetical protein